MVGTSGNKRCVILYIISCNQNAQKGADLITNSNQDSVMPTEEHDRDIVSELSLMAAQNKEPDCLLPLPERCLYYTLRDLYRANRNGELSIETCKQRKDKAISQYRSDVFQLTASQEQILEHSKLWARIEAAGTAYAKSYDRTETADAFYYAVYACMPKKAEKKEGE